MEPRDTPLTVRVHRKQALQGPRSKGRMPLTLGLMPPKDGFGRFRLYDRAKLFALRRGEKASDEIRQPPSQIILFVVPTSTAI
jgi:hypothetical protein